jgi:cell wall-associated NlpC family hydrolase
VWELQQTLRATVPGADVELLRATPVVDTRATFLSPAQISTILTAATSRVGLPYLWGGTGPNSFDCSGLVGWSFRAAGIEVPRTAAQLYLAGLQIDPRRAQPGDLLFWANDPDAPGFIDHVAIYLGGGKMVVAPHTGDFVKIATVPMTNFMGVVRLDPKRAAQVGGPRYSDLAGRA